MLSLFTVVLLHGLGERTWTLELFSSYLEVTGIIDVHIPRWPANSCQMPEECVALLSSEMEKTLNRSQPIVVVGNSMGGVAAYYLSADGWNITQAFYIAAPLHGSLFLREGLERVSNTGLESIGNWMAHSSMGDGPFDYLSRYWDLYPPRHSYWTISPVLPGFGEFDGHVFRSDTVLEESHALTVPWASHFSLLYDCRLWNMIMGRILVGDRFVDGAYETMESACFKLTLLEGSLVLTALFLALVVGFRLIRVVHKRCSCCSSRRINTRV